MIMISFFQLSSIASDTSRLHESAINRSRSYVWIIFVLKQGVRKTCWYSDRSPPCQEIYSITPFFPSPSVSFIGFSLSIKPGFFPVVPVLLEP